MRSNSTVSECLLALDHIAADGGRVVSVIWQRARQVTLEPGLPSHEVASGYVIVSEHELPQAAGH